MVAFSRSTPSVFRRCLLDVGDRSSHLRLGILPQVDWRRVTRTGRGSGDARGFSRAAPGSSRVLDCVGQNDRTQQTPGFCRWSRMVFCRHGFVGTRAAQLVCGAAAGETVAALSAYDPGRAVGAIAVAIFARIVGVYALSLWRPLTASTLWAVDLLLQMLGQTTFVESDAARIGTTHFTVTIGQGCSGLEGIGLMSVFVAGYLWFCRRELRFPASLILLPAGVVSIWFLNVVRIAALILIGAWSERVAIDVFHTVAGWLFYTVG